MRFSLIRQNIKRFNTKQPNISHPGPIYSDNKRDPPVGGQEIGLHFNEIEGDFNF